MATGLFLLPAMAGTGTTLWAQTSPMPSAPVVVQPAADKAKAQQYLKEGRRYLAAGDTTAARQLAMAAMQYKGKWEFWQEDTPEKLLGDIATTMAPGDAGEPMGNTIRAAGDAPALSPIAAKEIDQVQFPTDARALVKMGRDFLKAGKVDLAEECGKRALATPTRWGVLEFTPEKLLNQVNASKSDRDRLEAEKLLTDARRLYQRGELDQATEMARRAERMHGPYTVWDIADRPVKLLAEIDAAKARQRRTGTPMTPTAPTTTVANRTPELKPVHLPMGDTEEHVDPADTVVKAPTVSPDKLKATSLVAECRKLEKDNRLAEARAKALEAQKLGADFGPGEDRPEAVLTDVSQKAAAQINMYVEQAMQVAGPNPTAEKASQAQAMLAQSKSFAMTMGFDTQGIEDKMAWIKSVGTGAPVASAKPAPSRNDPKSIGRDMLSKANLELRNGQIESARKLAEAVYSGEYGLQTEAANMLRLLQAEERNQQITKANMGFGAGLEAFQKGEYQHAVSIFMQIDGSLLTADKQAVMRDTMNQAQALAQTAKTAPMGGIQRTAVPPGSPIIPPLENPNAPGVARAGEGRNTLPASPIPMSQPMGGSTDFANQTRSLQQVEFQRLRSEGLKAQREAQARFTRGETDSAIQLLQEQIAKIKEAQLPPSDLAMLQRPLDYRLQTFKVLKVQRDAEMASDLKRTNRNKTIIEKETARELKYKQVSELMKQYSQLMEEKKYAEAEMIAEKARELDPDSDVVSGAANVAKMAKRVKDAEKLKSDKEEFHRLEMNETDKLGPAMAGEGVKFDHDRWKELQGLRKGGDSTINGRLKTEREREIERKLSTPVTVDFNNTKLSETVKYLQQYLKINIAMDAPERLKAGGGNPDAAVSLRVEAVPLKSVLNLILKQAKMTYVVANDVLQIVSEKDARGQLKRKIYSVGDLVVPIDNYTMPDSLSLTKLLDKHHARNGMPFNQNSQTAMTPTNGLPGGIPANTNMSTTPGGNAPSSPITLPASPMAESGKVSLAKNTIEDVLIKLVTNTVAPHSWADVGGSGTIDYYPIGMALVINQFEDVQEQIADLLDQLRRLQDLEVAIEVRIVSVSESFFERIGMDFSLNIKTDHETKGIEPQLTSGQFKPAGYLNDPNWRGVVTGLTPAGTLTSDLDIPLRSDSFNMAIPPFGGYPNSPGRNGGLSLGLAFLNDIQVFMFMEAAQGDRRFNVMQAPKLTAFNGATATISVSDIQFFVTDLQVFNVNGQIIFRPVNTPFPTNGQTPSISLAIQPVVSADRRYVRLNMNPTMYTLSSTIVPLFPVTAFITPTFEGGFIGQPIPFTQFIQQPVFNLMSVSTVVSVPDGGTVVLGGLKTLSEGRNEFGPPVLSKIPYLNRLFRNTGYGREAQSMLILVTPRIIINREEAERQVGEPQDSGVPGAGVGDLR